MLPICLLTWLNELHESRKGTNVLVRINIIRSIFELKAKVLDTTIQELFPVASIKVFYKLITFLICNEVIKNE
jgi:hypothetical protein